MSLKSRNLFSMKSAGALALSFLAVGSAKANIVWDYSPDATHAAVTYSSLGNVTSGQNFLELVSFATSVSLGGMDIFSSAAYGTLGQLATVKIFSSSGGSPSGLLDAIATSIDAIDSQGTTSQSSVVRKHADFGSIGLSAGSYWIGMSGTTELAQGALQNVQDNKLYQLSGNSIYAFVGLGDMAFRLYDTSPSTPVPEPLSLALLGVGVLTVSAAATLGTRRSALS